MGCKHCIGLFEALKEAKIYIQGKSNKDKHQILRLIRSSMSPKSQEYVHKYNKYREIYNALVNFRNTHKQNLYWAWMRAINYSDKFEQITDYIRNAEVGMQMIFDLMDKKLPK
jgi:hypothetical protein